MSAADGVTREEFETLQGQVLRIAEQAVTMARQLAPLAGATEKLQAAANAQLDINAEQTRINRLVADLFAREL